MKGEEENEQVDGLNYSNNECYIYIAEATDWSQIILEDLSMWLLRVIACLIAHSQKSIHGSQYLRTKNYDY